MKSLFLISVLFLMPSLTFAQTTTVTGTITDPNGNAYANGTASALQVVAAGLPTAFPTTVPTNGSGAFSFSGTNALASPSSYQFTICATPVLLNQPNTNPTPVQVCFKSGPIAISGASQDISATLNAIAKSLGPTANFSTFAGAMNGNIAFGGNNTHSGTESFTGAVTATNIINCTIVNAVACISPSNPQGWAGSDIGAWINSINSSPAICATINCNAIQIAPASGSNNYNDATPIVITHSMGISCPGGPYGTQINWTPATGTVLTYDNTANGQNTSFSFTGCGLTTSTSTTSKAIVIKKGFQVDISKYNINGFNGGGIYSTGDGISLSGTGIRIHEGIVQNFCGASSFAYSLDHTNDVTFSNNESYTTNNCSTTPYSMIIDTGVGGLWATSSTHEQGISGVIVRNTNQGGAYSNSPAAIWFTGYTVGDSSAGTGVLLDATLGTNPVRFRCIGCWIAATGSIGSVTTAIGFDVEGGSDVEWTGGIIRQTQSWGIKLNSLGSDFSITGAHVLGSNQGTTSGVGSILVTANPIKVTLTGNIAGNDAVEGGHSFYGLDVSAITAANFVSWSGNDFSHNTTARLKIPSGVGQAAVDAPDYGGVTGVNMNGPIRVDSPIKDIANLATMGLTLKKGSGAGNYTTASTSFVVADSTNLCLTVTIPTGWKLAVQASGGLGTSTAVVQALVAIGDNGTGCSTVGGAVVQNQVFSNAAGNTEPFSLSWVINGDGTSHNVNLLFATSNAADSAILLNASGSLLTTMTFTLMPSN
jgi:hypothetical protein